MQAKAKDLKDNKVIQRFEDEQSGKIAIPDFIIRKTLKMHETFKNVKLPDRESLKD